MYYARAFGIALIAALAVCGYSSVRLARAGSDETDNTRSLMLRVLRLEYEGRDSTPLLERISKLTPLASEPRIRLGLGAEIRGDSQTAERWLLDAASVDQQFEPRWTLANFYFRAGRAAEFWRWMRAALERSYEDRKPIFELGRRAAESWTDFYSRAMPDRPEVLASYVGFLLREKEVQAVRDPAAKLAATPGYRALALAACDALIDAGEVESAAAVWTALGEPQPNSLLYPDFENTSGQGFAWRFNLFGGTVFRPLEGITGLRLRWDGQQPESFLILRQPPGPLRRNIRYQLRWASRTDGIRAPSGLSWRIAGTVTGILPSAGWTEGAATFAAGENTIWLELWYQRPIGETRAEGSIDLRRIQIVDMR